MTESPFASIKDKTDTLLSTLIPANNTPGANFLALSRDGSTIYESSFGVREKGMSEVMTEDTVFWLASCSKILTSLCAMKCVEQGLITLDEDATPYLPELAKQPVRQNTSTGQPTYIPRKVPITLRHLLTMTAGTGYPGFGVSPEVAKTISTSREPYMVAERRTHYGGPLLSQPGEKWEYSGAIDWAGELVEVLSGMRLGDYLNKYICEPCGVSGITFDLTPDQRSRLAGAHFRWRDGSVTARGKIIMDDVVDHLGGAGAFATARDFASVLLLFINEGKHPVTENQVLHPSTIHSMLSPQLTPSQAKWLDMPTPVNRGKPLAPGVEKQWGLGGMIMSQGLRTGRGKGCFTWSGVANTHWMADPEKGVVMVLFAQIIPQEDARIISVRSKWEAIVYEGLQRLQTPKSGPDTGTTADEDEKRTISKSRL
ncbi:beta-lactamase/transpeptidase-like protein [Stereum hirsutum FP-91666 SS1]|uniref:beta-lactamase/transpeptidase-like protein n=1 Tax=Stereum hirsutum (strain FP-91666) TaxID=721885 RepID=UPI000440D143|nr:beta-lactamase/transpeptidase-like protein [Stereum hirsutum FP-91666 SS1]EIM90652.1 beta-lactamase/transpeptidase-like protein [Stereum hirsutum FP-91666 SS1]